MKPRSDTELLASAFERVIRAVDCLEDGDSWYATELLIALERDLAVWKRRQRRRTAA